MYGEGDLQFAARQLRQSAMQMAAVLLPLMAVYVLAAIGGLYGLMLAAMLAAFACIVFFGDLRLMPAVRYHRFLREMNKGLRRSTDCILLSMDEDAQMQDGVQVRALHVEICGGGDSRIFYVNVSKLQLLPDMQRSVRIISYGRHVVACEDMKC